MSRTVDKLKKVGKVEQICLVSSHLHSNTYNFFRDISNTTIDNSD